MTNPSHPLVDPETPPLTKQERERVTATSRIFVSTPALYSKGVLADSITILRYEATVQALEAAATCSCGRPKYSRCDVCEARR